MQTEYIYPALADRTSPKEWAELGKPDLLARATARKEEILAQRAAARFDHQTDRLIRERFNIHLPA
jgi:trimethylamine--corrinoid protein Co-methyltransferase